MKRIGIDCRLAGTQHAGIGRYIENLVRECVQNKQFEWVLFFHNHSQAKAVLGENLSLAKVVKTPIKHYSLKEQLLMPRVFSREKLDLLHVPHFNLPLLYRGRVIVTIHDLLWHEQRGSGVTTLPIWQYWFKYLAYRFVTSKAVKRAQKILVPSQTVKKTLSQYYPAHQKKVIVTPEGVEEMYQKKSHQRAARKINKTLVYTGSLYPHKNVRLLVQALALLPDFKLVLVGARSAFQPDIERYVADHQLEKRITFTGYLTDQELIKLYQKAYALVFPSLSEGFGLPGLEAMAVGLPVVASDIAVFREIYQEAAAYFDPHSVAELVETIRVLEPSRKTLIKAGKKRVQQFSWQAMAEQVIDQYQKIVS